MKNLLIVPLLLLAGDEWKKQFELEWKTLQPGRQIGAVRGLAAVDKKEAVELLEKSAEQVERRIAELNREKQRIQEEMRRIPADSLVNDKGQIVDKKGYERRQQLDKDAKRVEEQIVEQESIVAAMGETMSGYSAAVGEMARQLEKSGSNRFRFQIARSLAKVKGDEARTALEKAVEQKDPAVAVAAIESLAARGEGGERIAAALQRDEWQVRLAAVGALAKLDAVAGIEPLIAALAKADGRLKSEINEALVLLTGENKHGEPLVWREWWEKAKADFASRRPARQDRGVALRKARSGSDGGTTFYGIPVKSKRLVFVLDRSGSMAEKSQWKDDGATPTGPGDAPRLIGDRKIDVCRYELKKVLASLPNDAEFNIIFFNRDAQSLVKDDLLKALPENKKKAAKFIDEIEPQGRTNIFDSIERAMGKDWKSQVDTIYLLSDGLPNCGQFESPADIRREVARRNGVSKITIHTIYVGAEKAAAEFMEALARENGGVFVKR